VEIGPSLAVKSDAEIDAWLKKVVITAHHPAGTCAMGTGGVLEPDLKVRGVERLRVCDASAMPDLVSAHINACVIMMADKASDMIRGQPALPRAQAA
jgi:choline dehydrogenase-like flavoprotein